MIKMESLLKSLITDDFNDGKYRSALNERLHGLHKHVKFLAKDNGGENCRPRNEWEEVFIAINSEKSTKIKPKDAPASYEVTMIFS